MIREVVIEDLDRCYLIESISYQGDEAATKGKIEKRIVDYPEGFIILEKNEEIAGFINSGATNELNLSDEAFKDLIGHDSEGQHVVILSVVVHPDYQGRGYASQLLKNFISKMNSLSKASINLICQESLMAFYEKHGFTEMGKSESEHGGLEWYEMTMRIKNR